MNTNPQAIRFANERARVLADRLAQAYYFAKDLQLEWFAQNLGSVIANDSVVIDDGAGNTGDGRPLATGAAVTNVVTRAGELIADMEANSNAKLNTILAIAVNPIP